MGSGATAVPDVRLQLLGGFGLEVGGQLSEPPPRSVQRLIAFLALAGPTSRVSIAGILWPDRGDGQAQACLRSALYRAHSGARVIAACNGTLRLDETVSLDVARLRAWCREAVIDAGRVMAQFPEDAYLHGILLPGWYDEWVVVEREYLIQVRAQALEMVAHELVRRGSFAQALELTYAVLRWEPWRETAHRAVVDVLLAQGNKSAALRHERLFQVLPAVTEATRAGGCDAPGSS